jgi:hypothetical protein
MFGIEIDGPTLFIGWGILSAAAVVFLVICGDTSAKCCLFNANCDPVDDED